jgi:hypothetical protein
MREHAGAVRWWVDFGTLLGLVRDGQLIPWDDDVDVGIEAHDLPALLAALEAQGVEYAFSFRDERHLVHLYGAKALDVWVWEPDEAGGLVLWCRHPWTAKTPLPAVHVAAAAGQQLAAVTERSTGHVFPAPRLAEDLLALRYGSDWRVPRRDVVGENREEHVAKVGTGKLFGAPTALRHSPSGQLLEWELEGSGDEGSLLFFEFGFRFCARAGDPYRPWGKVKAAETPEQLAPLAGRRSFSARVVEDAEAVPEVQGGVATLPRGRVGDFTVQYRVRAVGTHGFGPWADHPAPIRVKSAQEMQDEEDAEAALAELSSVFQQL